MKVSVSLPNDDVSYLDAQVADGRFPSRSAAFHAAVRSLRFRDLGEQYAQAATEWRESGDEAVWDATLTDGLE